MTNTCALNRRFLLAALRGFSAFGILAFLVLLIVAAVVFGILAGIIGILFAVIGLLSGLVIIVHIHSFLKSRKAKPAQR